MCTDFSSINKAFPKDCYPLPNIDRLVDSTAGYKNAGAIHQRMVNKVFTTQIGRNMEIYVDDMLIKSQRVADHEANLRESFQNLGKYNIQLNPDNCVFGVTFGDSSFPFSKPIKKWREFELNLECEKSFQELKAYLQSPQLLVWPVVEDILELYLAVSESAQSSVLIREEEKVQKPVFYVNRVMRGAETWYQLTKKLVYALIVDARKLKPYFEERNSEADRLSQLATEEYGIIPDSTMVEWVAFRITEVMDNSPEGEGRAPEPWYQAIMDFLRIGVLRGDPLVANKIQRQSLRNTLLDGIFYMRSFQGIHLETARVSYYDELANEQGLRLNMDMLEEKRAAAVDKIVRYKGKVAAHYNKRVWARKFLIGDLVLRIRQAFSHGKPGKLESPWEGPYHVRRVVGPVTYELQTMEGRQVPLSWNACHLRKYYV
ncbi:hypothetical protein LIER_27938 [Lithospermum erythrorhizon]|uniref:Reverse transcriptase domain-containing protein n=1 Tax=Lithospermum erythrorhizon TaxID=34254 RepID=A0AAV3RGT9_LITER